MPDEQITKDTSLFLSLVQSLVSSALIALGKMPNPLTKQSGVNLQEAELSIDLLAILQTKTKGNLSPVEQRVLDNALADLRMNYLALKFKTPEQAAPPPAAPEQQA